MALVMFSDQFSPDTSVLPTKAVMLI